MKGELKCAPGLWKVLKEDDHFPPRVVTDTNDNDGCLLAEVIGISYEERAHTAAMMAASKQLYVHLEIMISCVELMRRAYCLQNDLNQDHIAEAKAVMRKARGGK